MVPNGHPWTRRRTPVGAAELAATPLVCREPGSGTRQALTAALDAALPGVRQADPVLELAGPPRCGRPIIAGAGPGALSSLAVADDIALGRLRPVAVSGVELVRDLRAVWSGGPYPPGGPVRDLVSIAARTNG